MIEALHLLSAQLRSAECQMVEAYLEASWAVQGRNRRLWRALAVQIVGTINARSDAEFYLPFLTPQDTGWSDQHKEIGWPCGAIGPYGERCSFEKGHDEMARLSIFGGLVPRPRRARGQPRNHSWTTSPVLKSGRAW